MGWSARKLQQHNAHNAAMREAYRISAETQAAEDAARRPKPTLVDWIVRNMKQGGHYADKERHIDTRAY